MCVNFKMVLNSLIQRKDTFNDRKDVLPGRAAEVKDEEREAVRMLLAAIPIVIHRTAKSLP